MSSLANGGHTAATRILHKSIWALAIASALLGVGSIAQATPVLTHPILIGQAGETVICIATNVSSVPRAATMVMTNGAGNTVASDAVVVEPLKSAAISFQNSGNFPGFYLCQVDLEGSPRRTFRARIRTATDSLVLN